MYLDANNLYCWAMIQPIPTAGLKWLKKINEMIHLKIKKELDISLNMFGISKELHDLRNDYPLAPEKTN